MTLHEQHVYQELLNKRKQSVISRNGSQRIAKMLTTDSTIQESMKSSHSRNQALVTLQPISQTL